MLFQFSLTISLEIMSGKIFPRNVDGTKRISVCGLSLH